MLALVFSIRPAATSTQPSYAVELVAAAPATGPARATPEAAPPPPPTITKKPAKALPKPVKQVKPVANAPAKVPSKTAAPVTPLPGETPRGGSDIANVKTQGKEFPYPEYLRNLVAQIYRRWNRPVGNAALEAEVTFVILRDGTIKDITVIRGSRSYSFDQEAQGAIEAAGLAKAFGPLPAGYPSDYLPISFLFTPRQSP